MIARTKSLWAALRFALSRECHAPVELDEAGQQKLEQYLKIFAANGGDPENEAEVEFWRRDIVWMGQWNALLLSGEIGAAEVARLCRERAWKDRVYQWRKFIVWHCRLIPLLALASLGLWMLGFDKGAAAAAGWLLASVFSLLGTLDFTRADEEFEHVRLESLVALKAGDPEKSTAIWKNYRIGLDNPVK